MWGRPRPAHPPAAPPPPPAPRTARAVAKCAAVGTSRTARSFFLRAKPKCFAQAYIQCKAAGPRGAIDGNDRPPGHSNEIEAAMRSLLHAGCAGRTIAQRCARVENGVAV